jgi:hypothetical protein
MMSGAGKDGIRQKADLVPFQQLEYFTGSAFQVRGSGMPHRCYTNSYPTQECQAALRTQTA